MRDDEKYPPYVETDEDGKFDPVGPIIQATPQHAVVGPALIRSYQAVTQRYTELYFNRGLTVAAAKKRARERVRRESVTLLGQDVADDLEIALEILRD